MGAAWKNVFSFPHVQAPDSGMGCGTSFIRVQVRAQVVQSSSVIVFAALNFLGTISPDRIRPCVNLIALQKLFTSTQYKLTFAFPMILV